jgi:DNA-binding transcriptional LysR family regulator
MLLDQLRSFLAVAKHLGLREASSELHLTQSAVSKRLKSLQLELGAQLYTRTPGGIELTDAGRLALTKIEPILKQVEEFKQNFSPKSRQEREREGNGSFCRRRGVQSGRRILAVNNTAL